MNDVIEKRDVAPVLREMKVGDEEVFPIEQQLTVVTTIQRLQTEMIRSGVKWSQRRNGFNCVVQRTA
ncbi:hypothetical protein [uncultured Bacteroides sp.]|uniref:hypothetical protein n=1 Tax=uncultured Bacteroides sp. TaxID=162156 RepID=UPI002AAABB88|nr:hypothetical protein [uncultured Bacteroides sp.]